MSHSEPLCNEMSRWYCSSCGIVRDVTLGLPGEGAPWCRHNALDMSATRMDPINPNHPLADGPLPWGTTDPSSSAALPGEKP